MPRENLEESIRRTRITAACCPECGRRLTGWQTVSTIWRWKSFLCIASNSALFSCARRSPIVTCRESRTKAPADRSSLPRAPHLPLDRPEQCCGVCLPTLAHGGSASCPVIASGKRAASRRLDRRPAAVSLCHRRRRVAQIAQLRCPASFRTPLMVGKNSRSLSDPHAQYRVVSYSKRAVPLTGDRRYR